jgi:hypothetical protein
MGKGNELRGAFVLVLVVVLVLERSLGYEVDNVDKVPGVCLGEAVGPCREVAIQNKPRAGSGLAEGTMRGRV